ncbi:MAG: hypothetical protein AVDCRST_MAG74-3391 [uncultured Pyrinomonadaceae bacterium]|uniref:HTH araC/xylS-type domain-containing protein n=1 Tax=uncultured Pyrinomonadaceae bacterium TaxID=2283094 RepID=A0A6J4PVG5_9BACT|nr:MAG: hypothetical protein AVDCRST_MAG74-3391 [uncultured Pyrinomonadaceae bacterium]
MKVNWKIAADELPILFIRQAARPGLRVNHYRVAPGDLVEQSSSAHELTVTLGGCLTTRKQTAVGGAQIKRGRAGNLCVTPAGERVAAFWNEEVECLLIDVKPELLVQTALENDLPPRVELRETYETSDSLIQNLAFALLGESNPREAFGRLYADALAQALIFHLLKSYNADGVLVSKTSSVGLSGYRLRRVKEYVYEHLEEEITLAELAAVAGLSQFYFARAFRRSTGLTPQQFVMKSRLDRAKKLLADSDLPLVEVGIRAGFKSQSHFTTHFRRLTTHTPKTFRESKFGKRAIGFEQFE